MDPARSRWSSLIVDFTQNTTCHGVRYTTLETRFKYIRRLLWLCVVLTAGGVFLYFMVYKLQIFFQYKINVNVQVAYNHSLNFPAVTVCNENLFKMTSLQKLGALDVNTVINYINYPEYQMLPPSLFNNDSYYYQEHVCTEPVVKWKKYINFVTRRACATMCSIQYSLYCSSFLYNQNSQQCVLLSYVGQSDCLAGSCVNNCPRNGVMEFYFRKRYIRSNDAICTFEPGNSCPFFVEQPRTGKFDVWTETKAKRSVPNKDLTLQSGDGHYIVFSETSRLPGYRARYASPFINTTGQCFGFYYRMLGDWSNITVLLRDEELNEYTLSSVFGVQPVINGLPPKDFTGKAYQETLPSGIYQVVIEAIHSTNPLKATGVAIDNLYIVSCTYQNCMSGKFGVDFMGNISHVKDGTECLHWDDPMIGFRYTDSMFPDRSVKQANNFCRNPFMSNATAPFCYIVNSAGNIQTSVCDVKYCGCFNNSNGFLCDSGLCINHLLECDGIDHCGDNSDETRPCGNLMDVNCSFHGAFLCGYKVSQTYNAKWSWHRHGMLAVNNDPATNSSGSILGHYLFIDNRVSPGDIAKIQSPVFVVTGPIRIQFYLAVLISNTDVFSRLNAYLVDSMGRRITKLHQHTTSTLNELNRLIWEHIDVCVHVSSDEYKVEFEGIIGEAYNTILAVDDVTVMSDVLCENTTNTEPGSMIWYDCHILGERWCLARQKQSNFWTWWRKLPAMMTTQVSSVYKNTPVAVFLTTDPQFCTTVGQKTSCTIESTALHGHIQSPGFPNQYGNNIDIDYKVHFKGKRLVTLQSRFFNTEAPANCLSAPCDPVNCTCCTYDTVYVYNFGGRNLTYCGSQTIDIHAEVTDMLHVKFVTDSSIMRLGFSIDYTVTSIPGESMILAVSNGGLPYAGLQHTSLGLPLISPQSQISSFCLTFEAAIFTSMDVHLKAEGGNHVIGQVGFTPFWQLNSYDIQNINSTFSIQLNVLSPNMVQNEYLALLKNVKLVHGSCQFYPTGTEPSASCNFEGSSCGYKTISQQWRHSLTKYLQDSPMFNFTYGAQQGAGVMFVLFHGVHKFTDTARLQSPVLNDTGNEKCLYVDLYCRRYPKFKFDIHGVSIKHIFDSCTLDTWFTASIALPRGSYAVEFKVEVAKIHEQLIYFAVDNVNVTDGPCPNPDAHYLNDTAGSGSTFNPINQAPAPPIVTSPQIIYTPGYVPQTLESRRPKSYNIQLGNVTVMMKSKLDMKYVDIVKQITHRLNDTVVSCHYNYQNCTPGSMKAVLTELGMCLTFNHDGKLPGTTLTGSSTGLHLVLNNEEYEHTVGYFFKAGYKVFLHDPSEIPFVRFAGFSVPVGMHALLPIERTTVSDNLFSLLTKKTTRVTDKRYENCSSVPDPMYPGQRYTLYRCFQGCRSKNLYQHCGCVYDYMPGNFRHCTLNEYLNCGANFTRVAGGIPPTCDCMVACNETTYNAQISYAKVSYHSTNVLLNNKRQNTTDNFHAAVELLNHIDNKYLFSFVDPFRRLLHAYRNMITFLSFKILDPTTSSIALIIQAMAVMEQTAVTNLTGYNGLLYDTQPLLEIYQREMKEGIIAVLNTLNKVVDNLQSLKIDLLYTSSDKTLSNNTKLTLRKSISEAHQMLQSFQVNLVMHVQKFSFCEGHCYSPYWPRTLFISLRTCGNSLGNNIKILDLLNITINELETNSSSSTWTVLWKTAQYYKVEIGLLSECFSEYEQFLHETKVFKSTIKTKVTTLIDIRNELSLNERIHAQYVMFLDFYISYLEGTRSKLELVNLMNSTAMNDWLLQVERIVSSIQTTKLQLLENAIDTDYETVLNWYNRSLTYALNMGLFWKNDPNHLQQQAQNLAIWKAPIPSLQLQQLISYQSTDIHSSWPRNMNMDQFLSSSNYDFMLSMRIKDFYKSLKTDIEHLNFQLINMTAEIKYASSLVRAQLDQFSDSLLVYKTFVKNNLVVLNIFYGELKYTDIQDSIAYDITVFFSDMGGYMGLLIGMSVITLVEVIDLILYNTVAKCYGKKKKFTETDEKEMTKLEQLNRNDDTDKSEQLNGSLSDIDIKL